MPELWKHTSCTEEGAPVQGRPMDPTETGLRYRVKRAIRQMGEQHVHLRPIFAEIRRAIEQTDVQQTREALGRLQEALEAHFRLEDLVFFPALNGCTPATRRGWRC